MNPSLAHYQLLRRLRQQLRHHSRMDVVYLFSDYELANQCWFPNWMRICAQGQCVCKFCDQLLQTNYRLLCLSHFYRWRKALPGCTAGSQ